jgi:hypothetical protein
MIWLIGYLIVGTLLGVYTVSGFKFDVLFFTIAWPFLLLWFLHDTWEEKRSKNQKK